MRPARESLIHPGAGLASGGGYLPPSSNATAAAAFYRENSPYSDFVNNGPTRINALSSPAGASTGYRVPEPVLPPWAQSNLPVTTATSNSTSSSTEHVYAMPARVIRTSGGNGYDPEELHNPRSVGSLVTLGDQAHHYRRMASVQQQPLTASNSDSTNHDSVPNDNSASSDPVISRIKRDFERKQEFLRATNLPNYLASPQLPASAATSGREEQARSPHPVYFEDRFPVHPQQQNAHHHVHLGQQQPQPLTLLPGPAGVARRGRDEEDGQGHSQPQGPRGGAGGQFHLYGLQLGKIYFSISRSTS